MNEMIIWEDLSPADKLAIKALSTRNFSLFLKIWFQIIQGEKLMWNWHHSYFCRTSIIPATTNSMTAKIKPPGPDIHKIVNIIKIINFISV
ncbi:terminase large subunit [Klebsiella phage KL]|uniref:Terminase large subunit n=1 Tax=Klebsiella phage KL TaxID=2608376 RepID=A0A5P8FSG0_9CAUD|nr:terminase large subunit [Klebsiella phage KL]QFQ33325.1 terminase large subunit [Klebsiella phage KL]